MKVILKKTILDKLNEAIMAIPKGSTIDYIELTREEAQEFGKLYSKYIADMILSGATGYYNWESTTVELRLRVTATEILRRSKEWHICGAAQASFLDTLATNRS